MTPRASVSPIALTISLLVLACAGQAWAQATSGSISGRVTDPSGAGLPGVTVTVTSERTGLVRESTTVADGRYIVVNLPPDTYALTAVVDGFTGVRRSGLTLRVDERLGIDVALAIGSFTDVVTVEGRAPLLQTESAATGEVIEQRQIQDLPLLGRNFLELTRLTAGTGSGQGGNTLNLSVNGQREFANSVVVDGIEVTGNRNNDTGVRPSVDAVQEFKVATSAYAPEFGRAAGGVIAIQTRSGSNEVHGSASEFYRPTGTAARTFFEPERAGLRQHNFGATLGGPLRRNRTFFFGAYEGVRHDNRFAFLDSVPPRDQIRVLPDGSVDLSGLIDPFTGRTIPIFDPAVYAEQFIAGQFPGNVIPADRVSPAGLAVLQQLFPAPNRPSEGNGWFNNFAVSQAFEQDIDTFDIRVDHAITDGDRLSFVSHSSRAQSVTGDRFDGTIAIAGGGDADAGDHSESVNSSLSGTWTHIFNRGWVVETRAGYNHFRIDQRSIVPTGGLADRLGFGNIHIPGVEATDGLPAITLGFGGFTGGSTFKPLHFLDRNIQVTSSLSARAADHDVKVGGDVRRLRTSADFSLFPTGFFFFGGPGASLTGDPTFAFFDPEAFYSNGGSDIADLLLGLPSSVTIGLQFSDPETRSWEGHVYAQDAWRVTDRLTLMYGARYEYQAPFAEADDLAANLDPAGLRILLAGRGGNSSALVNPDRNNIAPRVGAAWRFTERTVLRGGWGMFFTPENDGRTEILTKNYPFAVRQDIVNSLFAGLPFAYEIDAGVPRQTQAQIPQSGDLAVADIPTAGQSLFHVDPSMRTGRAQLFNVVVQREIFDVLAAELGYVGSIGRGLPYSVGNLNINGRLSPHAGRIEGQFPLGRSEYHSLQAKVTRRLSQGLSALVAYTFGRALDNGPAPFNLGRNNQVPQDPFDLDAEWGPAANDTRHALVGSAIYELPFWRTASGVRGALGGWQLNGILSMLSGLPVNVLRDPNNPAAPGLRPNLVRDPELPDDERTRARYFDTTAFSVQGLGPLAPGNAGRNILRGPGFVNLDLSVFKTFRFTERVSAQLRVEAFNVTNTPHFASPNADFSRAAFGTITRTTGNARIMQFAVRALF
jgi:hypothetical protein